ncbi:MAG: IclR family transcriptional regulator [Actinobacteria bacterium]|nr:IclR family transcriptional regulator [Actinomycetota bacterium]MCA1722496.1 IclR family transcriptional regulator [Actinomycetota bacterium]
MEHSSGVGVLDKGLLVLDAVAGGAGSLAALTERTGLSRATAHRLAVALEVHRLLARDGDGRWRIGPKAGELAAGGPDRLLAAAGPVLARLRDATGESAQVYRRVRDRRLCVAVAERRSGLRDTVPVGSELPLTAGSAGQVLLAWAPDDPLLRSAAFTARTLADVRRRGWAQSAAEREQGVASVSAPVRDRDGSVVAAVSVSGPLDRLTRSPGRLHAAAVLAAAEELTRMTSA